MKKMQQAPTTFTTDANGQRLAHVALANTSQRATLYAEDLERLIAAGWSPYWSLTSTGGRFRYVLVSAANPSGKERSITVARLIAEPVKGFRVQYIDGDRCNLRGDNLRVVKGGGRTTTAASAVHPRCAEFITQPRRKASKRAPVTSAERHSTPTEAPGNTTTPQTSLRVTVQRHRPSCPRRPSRPARLTAGHCRRACGNGWGMQTPENLTPQISVGVSDRGNPRVPPVPRPPLTAAHDRPTHPHSRAASPSAAALSCPKDRKHDRSKHRPPPPAASVPGIQAAAPACRA